MKTHSLHTFLRFQRAAERKSEILGGLGRGFQKVPKNDPKMALFWGPWPTKSSIFICRKYEYGRAVGLRPDTINGEIQIPPGPGSRSRIYSKKKLVSSPASFFGAENANSVFETCFF
ncbi:hypothetical protein, partial [Herbaspirillum sp.]|uniref:hypothetical protein n=1 Tax=Herbaspirillum sp. TaxID=1890675 RepID=UPI00258A0F2F